jgi:cell division septation protein DedD
MSQEPKMDAIMKVMAVFFVSILSFTLGTYTGKRFSDYQNKQLAASEQQRSMASAANHEDSASHQQASGEVMSDEDIEKLAKSLAEGESEVIDVSSGQRGTASESEKAGLHEHKEPNWETKKSTELSVAKDSTESESKPREESATTHAQKAPQSKPELTTPEAGSKAANPQPPVSLKEEKKSSPKTSWLEKAGKYSIQVGSFPTQEEAQKFSELLEKKGETAFWVAAKVVDSRKPDSFKTWYRVHIGLFADPKEANEYKNKLLSEKIVSSAIVQKLPSE